MTTTEQRERVVAALTPEVRSVQFGAEVEAILRACFPGHDRKTAVVCIMNLHSAALEEAEADRDHYRANGHQQALRARDAEQALSALQQENERLREALRNVADCRETAPLNDNLVNFCIEVACAALQAPQTHGGEGNG